MPPRGDDETLQIPQRVRDAVDERDQRYCRVCGRYCGDGRALHHVLYGGDAVGMGGRRLHVVEHIITVGWLFEHDCHSIVHGDKRLWQPLALEVAQRPGVTMLQLHRWARRQRCSTTYGPSSASS
jgi:hypothetical protein